MDKLLRGLKLGRQTGGFVEPFHFKESTRTELHRWLDSDAISRLESSLEIAVDMDKSNRADPTVGDNREVLERIKALADALSTAIDQAPETAQACLLLVGHRDFGDMHYFRRLSIDLEIVAQNVGVQAEKLPSQSRRQSHANITATIANFAASQGIKLSVATNATFPKLCKCVFEDAGIYVDVRGAIRAHLKGTQKHS